MQRSTTLAELPVARWQPGPHGPGPHWGGGPHWEAALGMGSMGPGTGFGLGMGGGWWLVLLFALLVTGVVAAVLYLQTRDVDDNPQDCALAVLSERYAAGDLDDEEFERRRERLVG